MNRPRTQLSAARIWSLRFGIYLELGAWSLVFPPRPPAALVCFLAACQLCTSLFASGAPGAFPVWRHDTKLTGYQDLPGAMKVEPRVLAKYSLSASSGTPTFADLRATGGSNDVIVAARARLTAYDSAGKQLWESNPEGYVLDHVEWGDDLDGDGHNEVIAVAGHMGMTRQAYVILDGRTGQKRAAIDVSTGDFSWRGHIGKFLPGMKGKQIFMVTSMRQAESGPAASFGQFSLWSFDGKTVTNRWAWTPSEHVVYYPAVMVADLNNDGRYEAVIDSWCHVWCVDLATGKALSHTAWDPQGANVRQYGWSELIDVNGDGKLDFVNISLTKHVDVLTNSSRKLQLAWTRGWPDPVTTEARSLHCPSEPILDLAGDKKMKIVTGLFDGLSDKRWHLFVFDAATGHEFTNLIDRVPMGSAPIWGTNAGAALFCLHSTNLEYAPPQDYEIWRMTNNTLEKVWTSPAAAFVTEVKQSDDRRAFYFNATKLEWPTISDTDADGKVEFFTQQNKTGPVQAWGTDVKGQIVQKTGQPTPPASHPMPSGIPPLQGTTFPYILAADLYGTGTNEILLYDNAEISVLRSENNSLKLLEKVPSTEVPVVCDLLGNGSPALLTAGRASDGDLWVQARDAKKNVLWRYTFPHSGACGQYSDRPHYFTVGHFTGEKRMDVFTYASKPAARTYVLNGATGQPVWEREQLPAIERHFQPLGGRVSVWDFNHDGADDVLFCNPDFYCVADGKTGNLLVGPASVTDLVKWWAAYASPAVLEQPQVDPLVYLGGAYSSRCAIALNGKTGLWHEYLPTERWPLRAGNCGFNEGMLPPSKDKPWRGAQIESDGTLVCFDAATGKTRWKMPIPTACYGVSTGDIDGDGDPDILVGGQDGNLVAIADAGDHGRIVWKKHFDAPVSQPTLADVNGDGKSEIIVSVGDGYVYVLGK